MIKQTSACLSPVTFYKRLSTLTSFNSTFSPSGLKMKTVHLSLPFLFQGNNCVPPTYSVTQTSVDGIAAPKMFCNTKHSNPSVTLPPLGPSEVKIFVLLREFSSCSIRCFIRMHSTWTSGKQNLFLYIIYLRKTVKMFLLHVLWRCFLCCLLLLSHV